LATWLLHLDNALSHTPFFTREFLTKSNMTVVPTHPAFLFPRLTIKLEGRHFDTILVIETELQAALDILIEHNLQDAFKKMTRVGNGAYARKGLLRG
jgi:hypothetical protein